MNGTKIQNQECLTLLSVFFAGHLAVSLSKELSFLLFLSGNEDKNHRVEAKLLPSSGLRFTAISLVVTYAPAATCWQPQPACYFGVNPLSVWRKSHLTLRKNKQEAQPRQPTGKPSSKLVKLLGRNNSSTLPISVFTRFYLFPGTERKHRFCYLLRLNLNGGLLLNWGVPSPWT